MTSREIVTRTLEFRHSGRLPRDMWMLPWAEMNHPEAVKALREDFPSDFADAPLVFGTQPATSGNKHLPGNYVDEWGCTFVNIQPGVTGEVKEPISTDEEWMDIDKVHIPVEQLTLDVDRVNAFCAETGKFVLSGMWPRPFERLQFIRGTEQLYMDLMEQPPKMMAFMERMHAFFCDLFTMWAKTDVDGLVFMDDWGAQRSLLINPVMWSELFGPMYKDYIDIAHRAGKKCFMHSDGYTLDIYPHLIEMGLDAINSQVFCMGPEQLAPFAGQITFWGEMDRQYLLPHGTEAEIVQGAKEMKKYLYKNGGLIAQLEFGIGAKPENVRAFYQAMDE